MEIKKIEEEKDILDYLEARNLLNQYKKSKRMLLSGYISNVKLKIREPKKDKIYYFRINIQFRAYCYFEKDTLVIFKIDNPQK